MEVVDVTVLKWL